MKKHSYVEKRSDFRQGNYNWLLHTRYVRSEHASCLELADKLLKQTNNTHRFSHFVKASVLADAGRLQEAVEKFHSCIRLHPRDPEPLKQVAKCLYRQGRFQLALEAYLEANKISQFPDPEIYCALAECCSNLGDIERGVTWATAGVQAGGGERAGALLAKLLQGGGDVNGALAAYNHVLQLNVCDYVTRQNACGADTLASAGALCLRAGEPRRAFQLLGEALAQQPTQHAAALALAAMMLQHRDVDAALARLKGALSAHPDCVAAHANLGLALMNKKKYVAALTCLQRAVCAAPLSARAAHNLGLALLVCRRPASAFCRLASSAALQPDRPYTVLLIGIALERLGDSRADAAYTRASLLAPHDPLIRINLAGRHARVGRLQEALEEAGVTARLLQVEPDSQLASSLAMLASLLREAGVDISEQSMEKTDRGTDNPSPDNQMAPDEV